MLTIPPLINKNGQQQYRIIPSIYPPINFFEDLVDPTEMETLWEIESRTNERLRQEAGDIFLIAPQDRVSGAGSSVVMAAFTHLSQPSRFSDGSFGIYYASLSQETAIKETIYHREKFLHATNEGPLELTMRVYEGKIVKPLHDVRKKSYQHLHHPEHYTDSQVFGATLRAKNSWGILYNSVRDSNGTCIAALRPPTVSIPKQISHLKYIWNGKKITEILNIKTILTL